jgi:hypothetical protein
MRMISYLILHFLYVRSYTDHLKNEMGSLGHEHNDEDDVCETNSITVLLLLILNIIVVNFKV